MKEIEYIQVGDYQLPNLKARLFKETWLWTIFQITYKKWIKRLSVKSTKRSWWFIWQIGWRI